jgi:hypothetical protein
MMDVVVLITHYKTDLDEMSRIKYPCILFKKDTNKYNAKFNKISLFLKYIIDHYEGLPDYIVFINSHNVHRFEKIDLLVNGITFDQKYKNIYDEYQDAPPDDFSAKTVKKIVAEIQYILQARIQTIDVSKRFSSNFYVHKDNVRFLPKDAYVRLNEYFETTSISPYWTEKLFEYIGHRIFSNTFIEPGEFRETANAEPELNGSPLCLSPSLLYTRQANPYSYQELTPDHDNNVVMFRIKNNRMVSVRRYLS